MRRARVGILCALTATALMSGLVPVRAELSDPQALVERWTATLLDVMKDARALGIKGRYDRLLPAVEDTFDLPTIVRSTSGSHWSGASESQKDQLVRAFTRMNVGTLASRLDGYAGEQFRLKGETPGSQGTVVHQTEIVKKNGSTIPMAYIMARADDGWRVVDVVMAGGISDLEVRRSEYAGVLAKKGVDGLISTLNNQADKLLASGQTAR